MDKSVVLAADPSRWAASLVQRRSSEVLSTVFRGALILAGRSAGGGGDTGAHFGDALGPQRLAGLPGNTREAFICGGVRSVSGRSAGGVGVFGGQAYAVPTQHNSVLAIVAGLVLVGGAAPGRRGVPAFWGRPPGRGGRRAAGTPGRGRGRRPRAPRGDGPRRFATPGPSGVADQSGTLVQPDWLTRSVGLASDDQVSAVPGTPVPRSSPTVCCNHRRTGPRNWRRSRSKGHRGDSLAADRSRGWLRCGRTLCGPNRRGIPTSRSAGNKGRRPAPRDACPRPRSPRGAAPPGTAARWP